MAYPINGLGNLNLSLPAGRSETLGKPAETGGMSFQNLLMQSVEQTAAAHQAAEAGIEAGLTGGDVTKVEAFAALKNADLSLRMMLQIRNKVLDAYNEIKQMRM